VTTDPVRATDALDPGLFGRLGNRFMDRAEEMLGDEIDERLARIPKHVNEAGVDPFGFDPRTARYALASMAFLYRYYFRVETSGLPSLPRGRALFIANHSGQIPLDGAMLGTSLMLDAEPPRFARSMVERWSAELPFVSVLFPRLGQVIGTPENAKRLLENEEVIVVFPEGSRGISKTFDQRYQLVDFGLGFMRLALETNTPIVPIAVIGGEEQAPAIMNLKPVAKLLGFPVMPVTPYGAPFPLPVKYRLHFGDPLFFTGPADDDDAELEKKVKVVKASIQTMIEQGLKQRKAVFW
jgi:1-acyl-sn-glycerol-3-phosphate acyltransferase